MYVDETGLSDQNKMISTFFKACFIKIKNYLKNDPNQNHNLLTDKFLGIVNKHAPLKKKFVRGNNAPFMNREFQKEIYVRSRLRNKYWVEPSAENKVVYKKQKNKSVPIRRKSIKRYMDNVLGKGIKTNKFFEFY